MTEGENARSETPTGSNNNSTIGSNTPTSQSSTNPQSTSITSNSHATLGPDEDELELPSVVVYLVEPFSLGGADCPDRRRLAILALLRAYATAINNVPEKIRANVNVQVSI